jgi:hypothetical protein
MVMENYRESLTSERPFAGANFDELQPLADLKEYLLDYARERPDVALLTCLGIGFVLGWKLKPW